MRAFTQRRIERIAAALEWSLGRLSRLNWPETLFALGALSGFGVLFWSKSIAIGAGFEMVAIATNLVEHGVFGNPFLSLATGATANEPPLYPLLLALVIGLFGNPIPVVVLSVLANALTAALLPRLAREFFNTSSPGVIGAVLSIWAAKPIPAWDVNLKQLGLVLFVVATAWMLRASEWFGWLGAAAGAIAGAIALLNPASVLISAPCAAFLMLRRRIGLIRCLHFSAAFILMAILVNAPWLLRNYAIWGTLTVRTNLGMTLYSSNNDCAESSMVETLRKGLCYGATHPNISIDEAKLLMRLGEPAHDRQRTSDAIAWIRSHSARFARLTWHRSVEFWLPLLYVPNYVYYAVWTITWLSIPGLIWMCYKRVPSVVLLLAVLLIYPLPYYLVVSDLRYRIPVLWLSCLAAGYFVTGLSAWLRSVLKFSAIDTF